MTAGQDKVCVGAIAGAHGVKGEVRVRSFTLVPEDCFAYGPLLDEAGQVVLEPKSARHAKNHFVVIPVEEKSREAWEEMKGTQLFVLRDALPEPEEDEFYYDDLKGLTVTHSDGRALGRVKSVQNFGSDDLLEIVAPDGRTAYFLPFTREVIPNVSLKDAVILASPEESYLPEALQIETDQSEES